MAATGGAPPQGGRFRRGAEQALASALETQRAQAAVAATCDAVLTEDLDGLVTSWNAGAERLFGLTIDEAVGRPAVVLVPGDHLSEDEGLRARVLAGQRVELVTQRVGADGAVVDVALTYFPVHDEDGQVAEIGLLARDVGDRKRAERELRRYTEDLAALARQDAVTGLLTLRELHGLLEVELARGRRTSDPCALALVQLPDLPRIAGERGDAAADRLLGALGSLVSACCDGSMSACHLDDDELAVVLPCSTAADATALAARIAEAWEHMGTRTELATGVAAWPQDADDKEALLQRARAALRAGRPAAPPAVTASAPDEDEAMPRRADTTDRIVALLRRHLRMEIAYLSEFVGDDQVVRVVDAAHEHPDVQPDDQVPLEAGYCRRMVEGELPGVIPDTAADERTARLRVTREAGIGSYVGVPVRYADGRLFGTLCCASRAANPHLDETATHFAHVCARLVGDLLDQSELEQENRRLHAELIGVRALLAALDARDHYTGEHSEAVVELAGAVAHRLGLSQAQIGEVEQVALLHDIGKIGIPDAILQKRGPLDDDQWCVMHEHPAIGARIICSIPSLTHLAPAVRAEHERWDGTGYPDGLQGAAIPLASRIILACDAWHAMTSDRPYRAAMAHDAALAELEASAGTQFDPAVVAALVDQLEAEGG
jgi:PAS domain S-box-containing protein